MSPTDMGIQERLSVSSHSIRSQRILYQIMTAKMHDVSVAFLWSQVFLDAPFRATGKSDVEGYFDPPYFEWWAASKDYNVYAGFEESIAYVSDFVKMHGPFQGFIAFSQGAMLTSSLLAMRQKGSSPPDPTWPRFCILIGGTTPHATSMQNLFNDQVLLPSLHIIGEKDFLRQRSEALAASFHHPIIIRHRFGHIVPRLDDTQLSILLKFIRDQDTINLSDGDIEEPSR